jgi:hypothetical protein
MAASSSSGLCAIDPPVPPRVKDGRMMSAGDDVLVAPREKALGHLEADPRHGRREEVPVLRRFDGRELGADQLDAEAVERAVLR